MAEYFANFPLSHLSAKELQKRIRLFSLFKYPLLTKLGSKIVLAAHHCNIPVSWFMKPVMFYPFCGGENFLEAKPLLESIVKAGISPAMHFALEGETSKEGLNDVYLKTIDSIKNFSTVKSDFRFNVLKLSGIFPIELLILKQEKKTPTAEQKELWKICCGYLESICQLVYDTKSQILIDAEETWFQETIDRLVERMMSMFNQKHAVVYTTIQMYRKGSVERLQSLIKLSKKDQFYPGIKLVRGAYMRAEALYAKEHGLENPIWATKELTDKAFVEGLKLCFKEVDRVFLYAGTHNEDSVELFIKLYNNTPKEFRNHVMCSQLLGMSDHLTYYLAKNKYPASKFIPYGPSKKIIPYLLRRAEENTAVLGEMPRELAVLKKEYIRRFKQ